MPANNLIRGAIFSTASGLFNLMCNVLGSGLFNAATLNVLCISFQETSLGTISTNCTSGNWLISRATFLGSADSFK